jgi:hypothetical protein
VRKGEEKPKEEEGKRGRKGREKKRRRGRTLGFLLPFLSGSLCEEKKP